MADKIRLEALDPGDSGTPVKIFDAARVRVGRHESNDYCLTGERGKYVSAFHAEIYRDHSALFVADVGSQNGTLVAGVEIDGPQELKPGDVVQLGKRGPMIIATLESWESRLVEQGVLSPRSPQQSADQKRVVGEATLHRVVQEAVASERARNRKFGIFAAASAIFFVGTALTFTFVKNQAEKTKFEEVAKAPELVEQAWEDVVEDLEPSIFLCFGNDPATGVQAIGTAFAVDTSGVLATNAHIVRLLQKLPIRMVVQNNTGQVFPILEMQRHPDYQEATGPDVGLLRINTKGIEIPAMTLASEAELRELKIGTELGTLGFPAELQQTYLARLDRTRDVAPGLEATFKVGWIGRIVNTAGVKSDFEDSIRIQHSASLSGGTSGSPMFTINGHVVAINYSGLDYAVVTAADDASPQGVERILNPAQIGHALRIDVLEEFLNRKGW